MVLENLGTCIGEQSNRALQRALVLLKKGLPRGSPDQHPLQVGRSGMLQRAALSLLWLDTIPDYPPCLFAVLVCMVKRQDSVCHSTRRQPLMQTEVLPLRGGDLRFVGLQGRVCCRAINHDWGHYLQCHILLWHIMPQ